MQEDGGSLALPGVTVLVNGTNFGTATNEEGRYRLRLPAGRYALRFSSIGYTPRLDSVAVGSDVVAMLNVTLERSTRELDEITVQDAATLGAGIQQIDPEQARSMPSPFKGFQSLQVLSGVAASNELSNQYSVRGGGFNENLIFLNGFEIHMPFRPRQGEQEGLGLLNPELARRITLYTGGFPARYGGKISSTLDIQYGGAEELSGAAYVSLLDAGATASASHGRLRWLFGTRKAQARRFFATQELKGNYQPDYFDAQGMFTYDIAPGHGLEIIGIWADHAFRLDPRGRRTFFGTLSANGGPPDLRSVWISYDDRSSERDGYGVGFAGVRLKTRLAATLRAEHDVSYFETREIERFLLIGSTIIYDVITDPDAAVVMAPRGSALQEDFADNSVRVATWTAQGRYEASLRRHAAEGGWFVRRLQFEDAIEEHSTVQGRSPAGDIVRVLINDLSGDLEFSEHKMGVYAQDAVALLPETDRLVLTAGLRADYYTFNREWTLSPRISARYEASDRLTLTGAGGVYYQTPTYRELRGSPRPGDVLAETLNRDIRAQRSLQVVAGGELFVPGRRVFLRAEAYWKSLRNLVSYTLENVRINYSGVNDAEGFVYGFDLQTRGEFVPGMESWINYGFMVARERFLPAYSAPNRIGSIARPADQRHTVALFVQDYIPTDPSWKLHLRALFGSGLPYTPPVSGERIGHIVVQAPGPRLSARYPEFRRIDMGVTKHITVLERSDRSPIRLELTAELLNVFDITNTVAYSWLPDATGVWQRVPTRLTPRTINVRLRTSF